MNYRLFGTASLFCCALSAAMAQAPSKARLDAIWNAVDTRVSSQIDTWFEDGDYPKVIHLLKVQAAYFPHDYDVVTNLGWMQENTEDWDAALATYRLYRANNPQDKDAALPEATYYYMKKQYGPIPALLEPSLKKNPHRNVWSILAHAYERTNRLQDAKRVWEGFLHFVPGDRIAIANLAKVERKIKSGK